MFLSEGKYESMEKIISMEQKDKKQYYIRFVGGEKIVPKDEIVYIESAGRRLHVHMLHAEYTLYEKLNNAENAINDPDFLRIHQSYLVNLSFVERIASYKARLMTGKMLSVSKARYPYVKERYNGWKRELGMQPGGILG